MEAQKLVNDLSQKSIDQYSEDDIKDLLDIALEHQAALDDIRGWSDIFSQPYKISHRALTRRVRF